MTADLEAVTQALAEKVRDHRLQPRIRYGSAAPAEDYECLCGEFFWGVAEWSEHVARVLASLPDDRLAEAEAKVARVEALHRPDGGVSGPGAMCVECTPDFGTPFEDPVSWPCPTIAALSDKGEDAC